MPGLPPHSACRPALQQRLQDTVCMESRGYTPVCNMELGCFHLPHVAETQRLPLSIPLHGRRHMVKWHLVLYYSQQHDMQANPKCTMGLFVFGKGHVILHPRGNHVPTISKQVAGQRALCNMTRACDQMRMGSGKQHSDRSCCWTDYDVQHIRRWTGHASRIQAWIRTCCR